MIKISECRCLLFQLFFLNLQRQTLIIHLKSGSNTINIGTKVMTKQEFFERTGVEVSNNEFWAIHEIYCFSEVDKDEFCKMWCKMNARRVKNAKAERMTQQREQSYKNALTKWFDKYNGTQFLFDNYHTNIAYIKLSVYLKQAMSFAGISFVSNTTLSDVHFKVGQYLGIYRSL